MVMGSNWDRFITLLWKNIQIQKKRPLLICGTTVLPTVFSLLLLIAHKNIQLTIFTTSTSWQSDYLHVCSKRSLRNTIYCGAKALDVFYAPDVNISRKVMTHLQNNRNNIAVTGFQDEEHMLKQIGKVCKIKNKCKIIGGIVFSNLPPGGAMLPSNIQYKIRVHARGEVELTKRMFPPIRFRSTTPRRFKTEGNRLDWTNINSYVTVEENITILHIVLMLIFDTFLYMSFAFYVDAIIAGNYMNAKPWYFPCQPSYWFGGGRNTPDTDTGTDNVSINGEFFEESTRKSVAGVQLRNLRKVFGRGSNLTTAVEGLTLNCYEGQITVLVGPNGAGKTAIMHMLTGFLPPTSGKATIYGQDIRKDMSRIVSTLGLCPQFNTLYGNITVEEHVIFFAKLKDHKGPDLDREVHSLLKDMALDQYRKSRVDTLSGGTKRSLHVILALVGGPKVVILDEPTSGLDPQARHNTWNLLKKYRNDRTIIIITHNMDEADHLSDRVVIMVNGRMECSGSPMFLKKKYGPGYRLHITKYSNCNVNEVTDLLTEYVENVSLDNQVGSELSYTVGVDCSQTFPKLFQALAANKYRLKIERYAATETTMEEVFTRISRPANSLGSSSSTTNYLYEAPIQRTNTGIKLLMQQLHAMLFKRLVHVIRRPYVKVVQVVLLVVYMMILIFLKCET
ncbi:ATP-binding cassette sub-family A member 3 [Lamellibrachia satsuma]|nr:ATP-binding cassette sub-family A member 3 [Lamellibrachia satsuma]